MDHWIDNHSIGPSGIKVIIILSAMICILGSIFGIWLLLRQQYSLAAMVLAFSLSVGIPFFYLFAYDYKTMAYIHRQLSYNCAEKPRLFDEVNQFIRRFLTSNKIDYVYNETSSGSNFHSNDKGLNLFVAKDGSNATIFGINDKYGKYDHILNSFQIEASKSLGIDNKTKNFSIMSFPESFFLSSSSKTKEEEPKLLLEEPVIFYSQRMRPVLIFGWSAIFLGILILCFGIIGNISHLSFNNNCTTVSIIIGMSIICGSYSILQIPKNSRPYKIYSTGILESFSPPKSWIDPKDKFYLFNNLEHIINTKMQKHPVYYFKFKNPTRTVMLSKNIPGMINIIGHIRSSYANVKF